MCSWPFRRRQRFCAAWASLNIMVRLVLVCRSLWCGDGSGGSSRTSIRSDWSSGGASSARPGSRRTSAARLGLSSGTRTRPRTSPGISPGSDRRPGRGRWRVSACQISCKSALALGCTLLGKLLSTLAVLCTQQRCSRVFSERLCVMPPRSPAPHPRWPAWEPASIPFLQIEEQFRPALFAFTIAVDDGDQFLLASGRRSHENEQALPLIGLVFQANIDVDAVRPDIHVLLPGEVASAPRRRIPATIAP